MTHKYNVSIHAIFRNETKWLREWLEYHLMIGVDHFYLFCDDDKYREVADIFAKYECLDWFWFPDFSFPRDESFQIRPIKYILETYAHETKWLCVLDLDEFIFMQNEPELRTGDYDSPIWATLKKYEKPEIRGLHIPVATFGTNGYQYSPQLQTESFTQRGHDRCYANKTAKNFYRPELIKEQFLHPDKTQAHSGMYNTDFLPDPPGKVLRPSNILRVNHYATRSLEDWQQKVARGNPFVKSQKDWDIKFKRYNQNTIEDKSMHVYLPELKRRLGL